MNADFKSIVRFIIGAVFLFCFSALPAPLSAREIADMAGRKVIVPEKITKACADWSPVMYLLYALDPTILASLSIPLTDDQLPYVHPHTRNLPVTKGFFTTGSTANVESLLNVKPDVIVAEIPENRSANDKTDKLMAELGIPVVYVKLDDSKDYPKAFLFLGNLFDRKKRAEQLAAYGEKSFKDAEQAVARLPKNHRPRVYYAEGASGLNTECDTSFHSELIPLAGAVNVHHCADGKYKIIGREQISFEQVMLYNPDVIIAADPLFYDVVFKDKRWASLRAVREGKVYLTPRILFNWFDRPPSFMRILGIRWTVWRLYGRAAYASDIIKDVGEYYRLFLGINLPAPAIKKELQLK